jgi:hypothetical protein
MFGDRDEYLACHVSAFLRTRCLIFDMDTSGTFLDKHLGEFEHGSEATVPGIGISDDGAEIIDVGDFGSLLRGKVGSGLALLSVMEELGLEEVLDLVWYGVGRVVYTRIQGSARAVRKHPGDLPARSGPGSLVEEAVEDDCHPET